MIPVVKEYYIKSVIIVFVCLVGFSGTGIIGFLVGNGQHSSTIEAKAQVEPKEVAKEIPNNKDNEIAELKTGIDDKDQKIKRLKALVFNQDTNMDVGSRLYEETNKNNLKYRRENARLKKENDIFRVALEKRGVYYDGAVEEIDNPELTPLGLEMAKHEKTRKQLELERSKASTLEADYNRRLALFERNEDTLRTTILKLEKDLNKKK